MPFPTTRQLPVQPNIPRFKTALWHVSDDSEALTNKEQEYGMNFSEMRAHDDGSTRISTDPSHMDRIRTVTGNRKHSVLGIHSVGKIVAVDLIDLS
jgi:hypothetical protein